MKISGPSAVGPTTTPRKARKAGGSDEKFAKHLSNDDAATAAVSSSGPLAAVDALLALQEVPDATSVGVPARLSVQKGSWQGSMRFVKAFSSV